MTGTRLESEGSPRRRRWYQATLRSIILGVAFAALIFNTVLLAIDRRRASSRTMFDTVAVGDKALIHDLGSGEFLLQVYPDWDREWSTGTLVELGDDYIAVRITTGSETTEKVVRKEDIRYIQRVLPLKKAPVNSKIASNAE